MVLLILLAHVKKRSCWVDETILQFNDLRGIRIIFLEFHLDWVPRVDYEGPSLI